MKARFKVKETGEILSFSKGSLVCGNRKGQDVEYAIEEVELIPEEQGTIISVPSDGMKEFIVPEGTAMTIDWNTFRIEAAKDFLPLAVQMCDGRGYPEKCVSHAIALADELIKKLRES